MGAVAAQRNETVELLLARGADPNVRDVGGKTPLSLARSRKNQAIVALLLAHGARQ